MSSIALAPWRPARAEFDRAAAAHLLRRAGFACSQAEIESARTAGLEATLERLLAPATPPAPSAGLEALLGTASIEPLQAWWMARILGGEDALAERVALMWHNHFATSWDKVQDARLMHAQYLLFRERGLGDFRELLRALAEDPAMLVWLDGGMNKQGHANENFARELFELFALGIGHYAEADVLEAARAFTGWGVEQRRARFRPADFDAGEKAFLGQRSRCDAAQAIGIVLAQPACARHVARRLLGEFASAQPAAAEVEAVAAELVRSGWSIRAAIASILRSQAFFEPAQRRTRIAGPVEWIAQLARALDTRIAPAKAAQAAAAMGQALFRPPSVKGWDGGRAWIHAGTWLARHNTAVELVEALEDSHALFAELERGSPSAGELVARAVDRLLPGCAPHELSAALEPALAHAGVSRARVAVEAVLTSPEAQLV